MGLLYVSWINSKNVIKISILPLFKVALMFANVTIGIKVGLDLNNKTDNLYNIGLKSNISKSLKTVYYQVITI